MKKYIAVLGYGTVGSGVAEVVDVNREELRRRAGEELEVRYILVRHDYPDSPYRDKMVRDFSVIENDPEVSIVAECIGGVGPALDYVRRSLLAGKSVVTPNKELVARYGLELNALAEERGLSFLFEAAVAGGIPVLRPVSLCLTGNRISEVFGIINGTTNYILTDMRRNGTAFADCLREAQRLGYAEADPTADVAGLDAGRKICILADLCFGKNVDPADISITGITALTGEDVSAAAELGCRIKLLGRALRLENGKAAVYVAPHLVPEEHMLASVESITNAVVIRGNAIGEALFCGPGAGKLPTASAVVGDVAEAAQRQGSPRFLHWEKAPEGYVADPDTVESRWFVRAEGAARLFPEGKSAAGGSAVLTPVMSGRALKKVLGPVKTSCMLRVLG